MNNKVLVGMSGGVDSSVAAALLMDSGYTVSGVTLRLVSEEPQDPTARVCCSLSEVESARSVCDRLGLRHYVFNFTEPFEQCVVEKFVQSYLNGQTPNPCIDCNRYIKVKEMLNRATLLEMDHIATGLTRAQALDVMRQSFLADVFICSANAITQQGELYNVDGNGNRVSAMIFGPKSVIVVAGVNKIVPDLSAAVQRVKAIAAPQNAKRLGCQTPCAKTGQCLALQQGKTGLCSGCSAPQRICSSYTVLGWQQQKGRIKVILCGEELGY